MTTSSTLDLASEVCIPADHPALAGHFPGNPVVPAVVILDRIAAILFSQLATALPIADASKTNDYRVTRIVNARFHSPLLPGERLQVAAKIDLDAQLAHINASVESRSVASIALLYAR